MQEIYVNKNSSINSVNQALQLAGDNTTIYVGEGIYYEKIKITNNHIKIVGINPDKVIITYDDYAKKIHKDGLEYNTFRTYTLMVYGNDVTLENLTIVNSSGYGDKIGQAVALSITGLNVNINNCILKGYQDTLFIGPLPEDLTVRYQNFLPDDELTIPDNSYNITNTYVEGTVDFIFGSGKAFFKECVFHTLLKGGYVFAPSTSKKDFYGFTVVDCKFTSDNLEPLTYLARPWRDYGKLVLINCTMGNHIIDIGFDKWNDTQRDLTCRFYEYNSRYFDNHPFQRIYFGKVLSLDELDLYLSK